MTVLKINVMVPIVVTLVGIVTDVNDVHFQKALLADNKVRVSIKCHLMIIG